MRLARTNPWPTRRAFTLTEILVVIAIIAILVALLGAGIMAWISGGQTRNSERIIRGANAVFQKQWAYVVDQAKRETPSTYVQTFAGTDPGGKRAQVIWIKTRLMEAFPMSYAEINNTSNNVYVYLNNAIPGTTGQPSRRDWTTYRRQTNGAKAANNTATESGACLLMALTVSRGGAVLDQDVFKKFIADTDGDGVNELVDGFGTALQFYRFAWNNPSPNPGPDIQGLNPGQGAGSHFADPLDPTGTLLSWTKGNKATFQNLFHEIGYASTNAYYITPVIMSVGPDQTLGLPTPTQSSTNAFNGASAAAYDNVYSFNLKGVN